MFFTISHEPVEVKRQKIPHFYPWKILFQPFLVQFVCRSYTFEGIALFCTPSNLKLGNHSSVSMFKKVQREMFCD